MVEVKDPLKQGLKLDSQGKKVEGSSVELK